MRVFLIPIGVDQYEPYFEPSDDGEEVAPSDGRGWFDGLRRRFVESLREAEASRHRRHGHGASVPSSVVGRLNAKVMRWIVERAAEQRLLWHLRTADAATLDVPDDLEPAGALEIFRRGLKRDADRHLRWGVVHGVGLVASLALVLIPGPNVLGYFLTFTSVGHVLAWRGARHGLNGTAWRVSPNADLAALREVIAPSSPARDARVHAVAGRLGLRHLATFFERMTPRTA